MLQNSRGMFVAGCCFDELPPAVIMEAVRSHRSTGGAVFFDPGPRSLTFRDPERRKALNVLLDGTDVVLMTQVGIPCLIPVVGWHVVEYLHCNHCRA